MNLSPKEKAKKLIESNFNHLLKIPHIPFGDGKISEHYLDYLRVTAQLIASSNIGSILEDNPTPEQVQYYAQVLKEIFNKEEHVG